MALDPHMLNLLSSKMETSADFSFIRPNRRQTSLLFWILSAGFDVTDFRHRNLSIILVCLASGRTLAFQCCFSLAPFSYCMSQHNQMLYRQGLHFVKIIIQWCSPCKSCFRIWGIDYADICVRKPLTLDINRLRL